MTNVKPRSKWAAFKMLLLALPLLLLTLGTAPKAQADEHHGFYRRHGYHHDGAYRRGRHYREGRRGYYYGGRNYRYRRYYSRGGRRYYRYYNTYPSSGIVVNIPL